MLGFPGVDQETSGSEKLIEDNLLHKTHECQDFSNIKGSFSDFIKIYSFTNRPQVSFYFLHGQHEPGPAG